MTGMLAGLALHLIALTAAAFASPARGWRLWLSLFGFAWIVGSLSPLIEAVVFRVVSLDLALTAIGVGLPTFAILAAVAVVIGGRLGGATPPSASVRATPLRLLGVIVAYEALYFGAGMLVYPFVRHFYADKVMPGIGLVLGLQVGRALLYAVAAGLLLRFRPRHPELMLGFGFALVGGVALLVADNPYMPADIRGYHAVEVGVSNFIFGMITGWLLKARVEATTAARR